MAYYQVSYNSHTNLFFPRAIVKGKPVESEEIADALSDKCTLTEGDILAVLWNLPKVMHSFMKQGKSVHLERLGFFKFELSSKGVASLDEFDLETQKETVHVSFIPERVKGSSGGYTRRLVDYSTIEWIDLTDYSSLSSSAAASSEAEDEADSSEEAASGTDSSEEADSSDSAATESEG